MTVENIYFNNILVGVLICSLPQGTHPVTDQNQALQLMTFRHPQGTKFPAHRHIPKKRTIQRLQECLIVKKGKLQLDVYASDDHVVQHLTLMPGDIFILLDGGYGIQVLEDSEFLEVKNGPFVEDKQFI